jgi:hypothetical protein
MCASKGPTPGRSSFPDRDLTLAAIVDLPDGSFEVEPDPRQVRGQRRRTIVAAVGSLAVGAALVAFTSIDAPGGLQIVAIVLFALIVLSAAIGWLSTGPPTLKADSDEITYQAPFQDRRMPRSELASILRGEVWFQGRRSIWLKSYLFAGRDRGIAFRVLASWYTPDAMAAFAARLGVPLAGDFEDKYGGDQLSRE